MEGRFSIYGSILAFFYAEKEGILQLIPPSLVGLSHVVQNAANMRCEQDMTLVL
jgi:hypothetical protein